MIPAAKSVELPDPPCGRPPERGVWGRDPVQGGLRQMQSDHPRRTMLKRSCHGTHHKTRPSTCTAMNELAGRHNMRGRDTPDQMRLRREP